MHKQKQKSKKVQRFADVEELQERIKEQSPKSGQYFYDYKLEEAKQQEGILDNDSFHKKYKINFRDLPISKFMLKGLENRQFTKMTEVQRCVIPHALVGRDLMAASKTGSGKTLSYLIPLVEKLYRQKFIPLDGLGAIVMVPVRELAMQVFEVLNSITSQMELNIGLIIGGKDVQYEKQHIQDMNILVCTPGRLLQHLEETYGFQTDNLKMLVLDEADVMMDMGFRATLNTILENLPKCQTLLFSATLSKAVYTLANLSLSEPQKVFLHSVKSSAQQDPTKEEGQTKAFYDTPVNLKQYYMIVKPEDKLNTLYSFIKTHQKQKILIFVSTCKQARFIYEAFKKFRFGTPMYEIQGHQKQKKRMAIYFTFCEKRYGILVSTNIASRGLDFPMIDWVIQFDIPEDVETYVHRVGRTARYRSDGQALAFITEGEKEFVKNLKEAKINAHKIIQNPDRYFRVESSLQSICSQHKDVKYLAQRALVSYLKFVYKSGNKSVFKLEDINTSKFADSFGLVNAPIINIKTNTNEDGEQKPNEDDQFKGMTKIQKLRAKAKLKKQAKAQKHQSPLESSSQDQENQNKQQQRRPESQKSKKKLFGNNQTSQGELFKTKRTHTDVPSKPILSASKRQLGKIKNDGHFDGKNKIYFDDNLVAIPANEHRRRKMIEGNKKEIDEDRIEVLERRKMENKQMDDQVQLERRRQKRKKTKVQKEEAKKGKRGREDNDAALEAQQESQEDQEQ